MAWLAIRTREDRVTLPSLNRMQDDRRPRIPRFLGLPIFTPSVKNCTGFVVVLSDSHSVNVIDKRHAAAGRHVSPESRFELGCVAVVTLLIYIGFSDQILSQNLAMTI
jgi:hypothetical protein